MAPVEAVRGFIPRKWDQRPGRIDISSNGRVNNILLPLQFKPPQYFDKTSLSQMTLLYDNPSTFFFPYEGYMNGGLQLIDGTTGLTYADGAPVALKPSLASSLFNQYQLTFQGETIQQVPNVNSDACFLFNLSNYSYDYLISGAYQLTAFLTAEPGTTQDTSGIALVGTGAQSATNAPFIPAAGAYVPARKYVIAFSNNSSATGPVYTLDGSGLTRTVTTGDVTSTNVGASTTAGGYYPVVLQSNSDNTWFWLLQSLTNQTQAPGAPGTGKITMFKISLRELVPEIASDQFYKKGPRWSLNLVPNETNDMILRATNYPGTNATAVNNARVWMQYLYLVMPSESPSKYLADKLDKELVNGAIFERMFITAYPQMVGSIPSGSRNFTQAFQIPAGLVDWLVMKFTPESYYNNQTANPHCSLVPQVSNGECVVTNATINYQGDNYPNPAYGPQLSDNVRMYNTFLELCSRLNIELFGPPITYQQWLRNYCYIVFDLRGRTGTASTSQTNIQPQIAFTNTFGANTRVTAIAIMKNKIEYTIERSDDLSSVVMKPRVVV